MSIMTAEKDLKKLNRVELLEVLVEQGKENERLTEEVKRLQRELEEANEKLKNREIMLDEAGSIAEASLKMNGIFEAAQESAKQYLENIEKLSQRQEEISTKREAECEAKCAEREAECEAKCTKKETECEETIRRVLHETAKYCKEVRRIAEGK